MELAAANLDDLAAHFNRAPAVVIKRGRRLGIYLKSSPHPKTGQKSSKKKTRSGRP